MTRRQRGTITQFDRTTRTGVVTDDIGRKYLLNRSSLRHNQYARLNDKISFLVHHLLAGPTAQDITIESY